MKEKIINREAFRVLLERKKMADEHGFKLGGCQAKKDLKIPMWVVLSNIPPMNGVAITDALVDKYASEQERHRREMMRSLNGRVSKTVSGLKARIAELEAENADLKTRIAL